MMKAFIHVYLTRRDRAKGNETKGGKGSREWLLDTLGTKNSLVLHETVSGKDL